MNGLFMMYLFFSGFAFFFTAIILIAKTWGGAEEKRWRRKTKIWFSLYCLISFGIGIFSWSMTPAKYHYDGVFWFFVTVIWYLVQLLVYAGIGRKYEVKKVD